MWEHLNKTELIQYLRRQTQLVIKESTSFERLVQMAQGTVTPSAEDVADTNKSRHTLQVFIEKNWTWINSQLPCKGENRGRCTIYPCPEGRHLDCSLAAGSQVI